MKRQSTPRVRPARLTRTGKTSCLECTSMHDLFHLSSSLSVIITTKRCSSTTQTSCNSKRWTQRAFCGSKLQAYTRMSSSTTSSRLRSRRLLTRSASRATNEAGLQYQHRQNFLQLSICKPRKISAQLIRSTTGFTLRTSSPRTLRFVCP